MRAIAPYPLPGFADLSLVRPLLEMTRDQLRQFLHHAGLAWLEDPMNADPRFARVRLREIRPALEAAGLTTARIAAAARHLARAREALERQTAGLLGDIPPREGKYLLAEGLPWPPPRGNWACERWPNSQTGVGLQTYRPRFERLERCSTRLSSCRWTGPNAAWLPDRACTQAAGRFRRRDS